MGLIDSFTDSLLTFPDDVTHPLSIRAKALVFVDPRSKLLHQQVEQLAGGLKPILIRGETGTGKELLARHIHRASERPGLFVAVNCGVLNPVQADAEFFGYAAGMASLSNRAGWFGSANQGTLYLDEVADLSLVLQTRLLDALQTGRVVRFGALYPTQTEVRLVAATSIDLAVAVKAGKFHPELYRYLADGLLELPPLRERVGDILLLAEYFLGMYAQRLALEMPSLSRAAASILEHYRWPGNIRELENVVHFALLVCCGPEILPEHLSLPADF